MTDAIRCYHNAVLVDKTVPTEGCCAGCGATMRRSTPTSGDWAVAEPPPPKTMRVLLVEQVMLSMQSHLNGSNPSATVDTDMVDIWISQLVESFMVTPDNRPQDAAMAPPSHLDPKEIARLLRNGHTLQQMSRRFNVGFGAIEDALREWVRTSCA